MYGGDEYLVRRMLKEIHLLGVKTKKKLRVKYNDMHLLKVKEND